MGQQWTVDHGRYTTVQGDTWDAMACGIYGDEKYMGYLINANWPYLEVLVFPAGVVLNVPELPAQPNEDLPDWRRS